MILCVTVHRATVILSVAKNLVCAAISHEILRYAQNDDVFPTRERLHSLQAKNFTHHRT